MITKKLRQAGSGRFPAAAYNEDKVLEGVADLLLARNVDERFLRQLEIMHDVGINAAGEVERYMKDHSQTYGNSKTQNKQFHVALSVKGHGMDKYELADFADKFMEKMGYGGQPYFVYFHHDTDNNHVHILSTRINSYGIAISDSFDKMRMQRVTDEILDITPEKERQKLGIDIHWQKDKNGIIRGYGIIDHKTKTAFDGSQVLRMGEWMEPQQKEDEEKAKKGQRADKREQTKARFQYAEREHLRQSQKFIGSSAQKTIGSSVQSTQKLTNVDFITIAKHKNGKHYLRVVFNDFGRSEMFFLSKEETRAYLLAANALERERLRQQFTLKYLLKTSGGTHGENREWEVGNGYDDNDVCHCMGIKR